MNTETIKLRQGSWMQGQLYKIELFGKRIDFYFRGGNGPGHKEIYTVPEKIMSFVKSLKNLIEEKEKGRFVAAELIRILNDFHLCKNTPGWFEPDDFQKIEEVTETYSAYIQPIYEFLKAGLDNIFINRI